MEAKVPPRQSRRVQVATHLLRALLLLFGALVVVSHRYIFYVNFSARTIGPAHFILPNLLQTVAAALKIPFVAIRLAGTS